MYLTQEVYKRIEEYLQKRAVKDSQFPSTNYLDKEDNIPILQDGKNKLMFINDFVEQVMLLEPVDILNITTLTKNYSLSLKEAIDNIPANKRKAGLIITFYSKEKDWLTYQFIGKDTDQWEVIGNWRSIKDYIDNIEVKIQNIINNLAISVDSRFNNINEGIDSLVSSLEDMYNNIQDLQDFTSLLGSSNGIAPLDENSKVPSSFLPSYVDDVLEYYSKEQFPTVGEGGKIYVSIDENKSYRWSGSTYIELSKSLSLGDTESTAFSGAKGKANTEDIKEIKTKMTLVDKYISNIIKDMGGKIPYKVISLDNVLTNFVRVPSKYAFAYEAWDYLGSVISNSTEIQPNCLYIFTYNPNVYGQSFAYKDIGTFYFYTIFSATEGPDGEYYQPEDVKMQYDNMELTLSWRQEEDSFIPILHALYVGDIQKDIYIFDDMTNYDEATSTRTCELNMVGSPFYKRPMICTIHYKNEVFHYSSFIEDIKGEYWFYGNKYKARITYTIDEEASEDALVPYTMKITIADNENYISKDTIKSYSGIPILTKEEFKELEELGGNHEYREGSLIGVKEEIHNALVGTIIKCYYYYWNRSAWTKVNYLTDSEYDEVKNIRVVNLGDLVPVGETGNHIYRSASIYSSTATFIFKYKEDSFLYVFDINDNVSYLNGNTYKLKIVPIAVSGSPITGGQASSYIEVTVYNRDSE